MKIISSFLLLALFVALLYAPAFAQGSGYYENTPQARPPSAFSKCCCHREAQNSKYVFYTCSYFEDNCPDDYKLYNTSGFDCPSNLMFTKYDPNKQEEEE